MSPPPAALLSTPLVLMVLMVLMVYSAEGHPATRSERCLCTGRTLVNLTEMSKQMDLKTILKESVVYRPSMFCTKTEITLRNKCISPTSRFGQIIIKKKVGREPESR